MYVTKQFARFDFFFSVLIFLYVDLYSELPKCPGKQRNALGMFYFKIAFLFRKIPPRRADHR